MPETHAYLIGSLFWLALWGILFAIWPTQRRAMWMAGLWLAPAGPIDEIWSLRDYWHPTFVFEFQLGSLRLGGPEDIILTFALAGLASGLFERFCARHGSPPLPRLSWKGAGRLALWPTSVLMVMVAVVALGLNSIYALFLALLLVCPVMLYPLRRWWLPLLGLSAGFALAYVLFLKLVFLPLFPCAFEVWWKLENTCGLCPGGIPLEEGVWAALTFLFAGPYLRASLLPTAQADAARRI